VFDPKSFYGQQWKMDGILDNIGQFFRTQDKPDFSIQFSRYRREAIVIIQEEVDKAKPGDIVRIYAVGGEEILFDCLNAISHFPNTELAVVPYGETNNFLRIFGEENVQLFQDIPSLVPAQSISTDVIKWGINYALNSCYIGVNSAAAVKLKAIKSSLNKLSFILFSKFVTFFNYFASAFDSEIASQDYIITIDDQDYSGNYSLIHIANGPYHNGKMTGASAATPDDGMLDIALLKASNPLRTMVTMRRYSNGKRPRNCVILQAQKIKIHSNRQMWIQLDNEYIRDTDISLSVVSGAVQMVALNDLSYPLAVLAKA
jgi:diacylglycerol kinase family enzyme